MRVDPRIADLYSEMDAYVGVYPAHAVERADAFALGTAFFPVGAGLWRPGTTLGQRPIVIVAHIFDGPSYRYALGPGGGNERVSGNRTWLGLRKVLDLAEIDIESCFLTNALMGIKTGRATGAVRGGRAYRSQCAAFLARQLQVLAPRLVVSLGVHAMTLLALAVPALGEIWRHATTVTALDLAVPPSNVVRAIRLRDDLAIDVAVLRHPCTWTNASRPGCTGRGARADAEILRRAMARES